MTNQQTLFDAEGGNQERDKAMELIQRHRYGDYVLVGQAIERVARRMGEFTSDAVWTELMRMGKFEFTQPNVLGAAIHRAAKAKVIADTGRVEKSARVHAHSRKIQVWRSLIFQGGVNERASVGVRDSVSPEGEEGLQRQRDSAEVDAAGGSAQPGGRERVGSADARRQGNS